MDELHPRLVEAIIDLKEIKEKVTAIEIQQAVDHVILKKHESRSTNLEGRVTPLEVAEAARVRMRTLLLGSSGLIGIPAAILTILKVCGKL